MGCDDVDYSFLKNLQKKETIEEASQNVIKAREILKQIGECASMAIMNATTFEEHKFLMNFGDPLLVTTQQLKKLEEIFPKCQKENEQWGEFLKDIGSDDHT